MGNTDPRVAIKTLAAIVSKLIQNLDTRLTIAQTSANANLAKSNNLSDVASRQTALNNLANAIQASSNEFVLTKDTATGNIILKAAPGSDLSAKMDKSSNLSDVASRQIALNNLANAIQVGTNEFVLTKDTATGNIILKQASAIYIKATQAEAETGTDDTKLMTPIRVKQSFIYQALNYVFSGLSTTSKTLIGAINELFTNKVNTDDARLIDNRTPIDGSVTFAKLADEFKSVIAMASGASDWNAGDVFTRTLTANTTLSASNLHVGTKTYIISGSFALTGFSWIPTSQIIGEYTPGTDKHIIEVRCTNATSGQENGWCFINKSV